MAHLSKKMSKLKKNVKCIAEQVADVANQGRCGCERLWLRNRSSDGMTWALEAEEGWGFSATVCKLCNLGTLSFSLYQPGSIRKHLAQPGGSMKGLLKGLLALGFREGSPWAQEQWGVTTTCSNWREGCVKRAACRTVALGRGMQPTLGDLAGSWRKKSLNFILLLPLGLLLLLPIDQTQLEAHAVGLPGTERVEKGKE